MIEPTATRRPTLTIAPSRTPGPTKGPGDPNSLDTHGVDRYDCGDFDTWEEANAVYQANLPGDPNKLDANDDGSPCDSLR